MEDRITEAAAQLEHERRCRRARKSLYGSPGSEASEARLFLFTGWL